MTEPGARRPLTGVGAITLVVEDLAAAREFYDRVFGAHRCLSAWAALAGGRG